MIWLCIERDVDVQRLGVSVVPNSEQTMQCGRGCLREFCLFCFVEEIERGLKDPSLGENESGW